MYISILEQQAKYGAALEVLSGSLGSLLPIEVDKYRIQVELLFYFLFPFKADVLVRMSGPKAGYAKSWFTFILAIWCTIMSEEVFLIEQLIDFVHVVHWLLEATLNISIF